MANATIRICARGELAPQELQHVDDVERRVFGDPRGWQYQFAEPTWYVLVQVRGEIVSQVAIFERIATVNGIPIRIAGVGGVATLPEWRRRGFASAALAGAAGFARDKIGAEFGLLICGPGLVPWYRKAGWREVSGPLIFDQPSGKVTFEDVVMILQLRNLRWPEGVIDLCGLPW